MLVSQLLRQFPFTCRRADAESEHVFLRELVVSFGNVGFVALFEIEDEAFVTIIAVRHQREDDYY